VAENAAGPGSDRSFARDDRIATKSGKGSVFTPAGPGGPSQAPLIPSFDAGFGHFDRRNYRLSVKEND
jgi:hypothetical protein